MRNEINSFKDHSCKIKLCEYFIIIRTLTLGFFKEKFDIIFLASLNQLKINSKSILFEIISLERLIT